LEGNTAKTDVEGIAVFDKLKFREALPGNIPTRCHKCGANRALTNGCAGSYQIVFSLTTEDAWTVPDIIEVLMHQLHQHHRAPSLLALCLMQHHMQRF
jgi:hypothetical protein